MSGGSSRLEAVIGSRAFCVTSEIVPPRSARPDDVERQALELVGYADAVNVTDNPIASAHMSPLAGAALAARAGLEPTLQLTVRDRNRLALAADLMGGWVLGARNLLCLTGDPLAVGDEPDATVVNDLALLDLVKLARTMAEGRLPSGAAIDGPPRYYVGVADSPLLRGYDPARLEVKLDAGAAFVMTQIAYDVEALVAWADLVRPRGVFERAAVIVGVAPLRSVQQARYMNEHVPGVSVPPDLVEVLEDAGPGAEQVGTARCVDIVRRLRDVPGIAGVHVMGIGREEAVRHVIEAADLLPRPLPGAQPS
ncbi:MAG TPA: methylenetetrahydrofolate reductase [Actinomycetota bacterium]